MTALKKRTDPRVPRPNLLIGRHISGIVEFFEVLTVYSFHLLICQTVIQNLFEGSQKLFSTALPNSSDAQVFALATAIAHLLARVVVRVGVRVLHSYHPQCKYSIS